MFRELVGPHYKRITGLLLEHGIDIVSLDCDGVIDALLPIWLENGVNTMFPIEVGTWGASIAPWRAQYGRALLGVGGMDKRVLARDRAAVDREIERLKSAGGTGRIHSVPGPPHRARRAFRNWCSITASASARRSDDPPVARLRITPCACVPFLIRLSPGFGSPRALASPC